MMGMTYCITMQSLGEIEQYVLAVGAKIWCLYVFFVCHAPKIMFSCTMKDRMEK